jgi:hypothetical protein
MAALGSVSHTRIRGSAANFSPEGKDMSNQTGERYSCSDTNCGCEVEVRSPSRMASSEDLGDRSQEMDPGSRQPSTSERSVDSGRQSSGRSGMQESYGSYGSSRSRSASERDLDSQSAGEIDDKESASSSGEGREGTADRDMEESTTMTLICFCGSPMRSSTSTSGQRARGASAS